MLFGELNGPARLASLRGGVSVKASRWGVKGKARSSRTRLSSCLLCIAEIHSSLKLLNLCEPEAPPGCGKGKALLAKAHGGWVAPRLQSGLLFWLELE